MIRKLAFAAAISALAIPVAAAAQTDPVFDAYRAICVSTGDDYAAVLKAADASGWKETAVVPPANAAISVTDQAAREMSVGNDHLTLLVSRGLQHMKNGDVPETTCRLEASKPHAGAIDLAKNWLGLSPDGGDTTMAYFIVTGPPDKLVHNSSSSIPPGGLSIIKVQLDSSSAIFINQHFTAK